MHTSFDVAQAFLDLAGREDKTLTNMQLQKLVYFAHGVHLAAFDDYLVIDTPFAWNFGPVFKRLYEKLQPSGKNPISAAIGNSSVVFSDSQAKVAIDLVWKNFKDMSAAKLSAISHAKDSPWDTVFNKREARFSEIPDDLTKKYYKTLVTKSDD